jgi:hypothetical protein
MERNDNLPSILLFLLFLLYHQHSAEGRVR